jgi:prepilin-type N-terminal cleavage/methylation domain-containing protein
MKHTRHTFIADFFRRGFSLVEILVTVALLSVIILGLVAMFNQTRRAFTSSITQVDVLESGRDAAGLIAQEMEQMAAAGSVNVTNFYVQTTSQQPMFQTLVDASDVRTNTLQAVFFLTRLNQTWTGVGYRVFPGDGVGTLYRYSGNNISATNGPLLTLQWSNFNYGVTASGPGTNFTRIMDGVVNFRIRAYDTNGNQLANIVTPTVIATNYFVPMADDHYYQMTSNSLPAYVEIELGVLEDRALARYQALSNNPTIGLNYLANHPGQVHMFRQRIPIRNVSSAAYQ